jgi:hypothetical protein
MIAPVSPPASPPPSAQPAVTPALPNTAARSRVLVTTIDSAVFAYEQARYDTAAFVLRRALVARGADSLSAPRRLTALAYLGAAELARNNRDSATAAFRALISEAPHRSLDAYGFSPAVTDFYTSIRRSLSGLARLQEGERAVVITLLAITPHYVSVEVLRDDGRRVVSLYDGQSADSLSLTWDRRGADGVVPPPGRYQIVVTARAADGRVLNVVRFPVTTR